MANHKIMRFGTAGQWMVVLDGDRGMPEGGFNRQILTKISGTNNDAQWRDPAGFTFTQGQAPTLSLDGTSPLTTGQTWWDTTTNNGYVRVASAWVQFSWGDSEARYLNVAGDTLTGQLNGITPVAATNLTRKDYVDGLIATVTTSAAAANTNAGTRVLKAGDTMTGALTMNANINMGAGRKIDFTDELGVKVDLYGGSYTLEIESGVLRYRSGGTHQFTGSIGTNGRIDASSHIVANASLFANMGRVRLGAWQSVDAAGGWGGLIGSRGYILIDYSDGSGGNMHVRGNNTLYVGGGSTDDIYFTGGGIRSMRQHDFSGGIQVDGQATCSNSYTATGIFISNYAGQGWYYNDSHHYANGPSSGVASMGFHPGGVACQWRMGANQQILYCMGIGANDNNVTLVAAVYSNGSSRSLKQDIVDWPLAKTRAVSEGVDEMAPSDPIDLLRQVRPVWFRRKREQVLAMLPKDERRLEALKRLNEFRMNRGMEQFQSEELIHQCGRDCNWSESSPCEQVRNWETGEVGFIAEELGPILPQVGMLDPHLGGFQGLNLGALASFGVAASKQQQVLIDALMERVEALEAQVAAQQ